MIGLARAALAFVLAAAFLIPAALAQQQPDQGVVRAQGRIVGQQDAPPTGPARAFVDYREEMRKFIQQIAAFTRRTRKDFMVLPQGGLDLLSRKDEADETKSTPARTYMRSVDGILVEGLFYGRPAFSPEDFNEVRPAWIRQADFAKKNGLKVFVIDQVGERGQIDQFHRRAGERGFVGFAVANADFTTLEIPPYPARPIGENALSILSIGNVKNFVYLSESAAFGRMDEFALTMHGTNFDMVVVDMFHGRDPLSKQAIATLKYKKSGGKRLALAHINIGTAASYRYYWKPNWHEGSPGWISAPVPGDSDRHFVEYWKPEWKSIISGDANSYVYGAVDLGFDGVVLSGVDTYRFFETGESGQVSQ